MRRVMKMTFALGVALLLALNMGCSTIRWTMFERGKHDPSQYKNYFVRCYEEIPEKLWTGLSAPFYSALGPFAYEFSFPGWGENGITDLVPIFITAAIGGVLVTTEGIYNLVSIPFPLPSAGLLMHETVNSLQQNLNQQSLGSLPPSHGKRKFNEWYIHFYDPYYRKVPYEKE